MRIVNETCFRVQFLVPNKLVAPVREDHESWWIRIDQRLGADLYFLEEQFLFSVRKDFDKTRNSTKVTMRAEVDLWINEPGISVIIEGDGTWRGIGPKGQYTSKQYGLSQKDAHISTVHFTRRKENKNYTTGIEYREDKNVIRWFASDGFATLFRKPQKGSIKWKGCKVGGRSFYLTDVYNRQEDNLRWELAGTKALSFNGGQMHFLGATNGPSCCVNADGRNEGIVDHLYNPLHWRFLPRRHEISQTIRKKVIASQRSN